MAGIVEKLRMEGEGALRKHLSLGMHGLCTEAADEIERLRAAIQPLADEVEVAEIQGYAPPDERMLMFASDGGGTFLGIEFGHLRRAREALKRS